LLSIDAFDVEIPKDQLDIDVIYKFNTDTLWQTEYISNLAYNSSSGSWEADFNPSADAKIGEYDFRVTCNDSDTEVYSDPN